MGILHTLREDGRPYSRSEIAAWCDCMPEAIKDIEAKALAKLRKAFKRLDATGSDSTSRQVTAMPRPLGDSLQG